MLIGFPLAGYLASYSNIGWEGMFYTTGGIGFLWTFLWIWVGASSPSTHFLVSDREKNYIEESLGETINEEKKVQFRLPVIL